MERALAINRPITYREILMPQHPEELDDALYEQIVALIELGNEQVEVKQDLAAAIGFYDQALKMLPKPIERWDAAVWLLVALGDCYFLKGEYPQALEYLKRAIQCPGAVGTGFIHLRLGQTFFELNLKNKAADELTRAYMAAPELFESQDPKYFAFLKTRIRGLPGGFVRRPR